MLIGIDGNEANVDKRVGIGEYAYELLRQFNLKSQISNCASLARLPAARSILCPPIIGKYSRNVPSRPVCVRARNARPGR